MILVDTSVWIDHLHGSEPLLVDTLEDGLVAQHPMVIGELALGSIKGRAEVLGLLANLDEITIAEHDEVMAFVDREALYGRGLSLVDVHLLSALRLDGRTELWTRDKRLRAVAVDLGVAVTQEDGRT